MRLVKAFALLDLDRLMRTKTRPTTADEAEDAIGDASLSTLVEEGFVDIDLDRDVSLTFSGESAVSMIRRAIRTV